MEWRQAASYANRLMEESSWSRTIYTYTKAALLLQLGDAMTPAERQQCNELMRYHHIKYRKICKCEMAAN